MIYGITEQEKQRERGVPKKHLLECFVSHLVRIRARNTRAAEGANDGGNVLGAVQLRCVQAHADGGKGLQAFPQVLQGRLQMGFKSRRAGVRANCSVPLKQGIHERHNWRIFSRYGNVQHTNRRAARNN